MFFFVFFLRKLSGPERTGPHEDLQSKYVIAADLAVLRKLNPNWAVERQPFKGRNRQIFLNSTVIPEMWWLKQRERWWRLAG